MLREGGPRRLRLAQDATDYVLRHGLIGLSLRPLAAELGTSDRMLLYHFGGKDDLVLAVLQISNDRSIAELRALPPSSGVREAVRSLWVASSTGQLEACQRLYVEAAALGLLDQEPYADMLRESNRRWLQAVAEHLVSSGCPPGSATRAAYLLDSAFMGFQLDMSLYRGTAGLHQAVGDLGDAVAVIAGAAGP